MAEKVSILGRSEGNREIELEILLGESFDIDLVQCYTV
jgi:hypothetical protein